MPEDFEISKIKAGKPKGSSHVNVNPTIDAPKTQGGDTPAKQTLNRIAKPVKLKEANFSPAASVMFAQKGTLARVGIQNAPAAKSPASSSKLPKMMTGPKTARSYARRLARITPAHSVQRTTQGTSLPGANFMASETKNEDVKLTKTHREAFRAVRAKADSGDIGAKLHLDKMVAASGLGSKKDLDAHITHGKKMGYINEDTEVKKWPQGPNNTDPLASTEMKSAMASASMKTLKQNLQWALKKDNLDHTVDPDTGEAQEQLAGAPYNKSDNAAAVDTEELLQHQHKTGEYKFESEAKSYQGKEGPLEGGGMHSKGGQKHLKMLKDREEKLKLKKKFESEEPIEEISDELLYRAQSKATHLRDKASTQKKRALTSFAKTSGNRSGAKWDNYVKHSDETTKRHNQALKFWRARGRQGSFKPHKEVD